MHFWLVLAFSVNVFPLLGSLVSYFLQRDQHPLVRTGLGFVELQLQLKGF